MWSNGPVEDGEEGVLAYIDYVANKQQAAGKKNPFFMMMSLINPHDVLFYPSQFDASGYPSQFLEGMSVSMYD